MEGDVLRIGRGTRAALRSDNPATSLDHATIARDDAGYTITDLGSITGTYVNGKPVESARLKKGDVIEIGDLRLEVQKADPAQPLFMRISQAALQTGDAEDDQIVPAVAPKAGVSALKAPKVDYADAFRLRRPYLTKLTLTAILAIICVALLGEVTKPRKQVVFAPGGLSSAHARVRDEHGEPIVNDCHSCHVPFGGVTNAKCETCHGPMVHATNQISPPPCINCHAEHRGATRLAAIGDRVCVECHDNLIAHMKKGRRVQNIASFATGHPEFTYAPDPDTLRFNHRLHLAPSGIFNGQGKREALTCTSCHHLTTTKGKIDPAPVRFDRDCRPCHKLTFDPRFRDVEVPHGGDPGLVYGFILATYAGNRDIAGKPPEEVRRILTQQRQTTSDQRAVLGAEQVIKVKCSLCHEIRRAGSRLMATPPVIPTRWLESKFSHGPHRNIGCDECHGQARKSAATSDVLLPQRRVCLDCHGERPVAMAGGARRSNDCVLCHEYHVRSNVISSRTSLQRAALDPAGMVTNRRMFEATLIALIVVLLVVVLLPAGIALFRRLSPPPPDRGGERRAAPPQPPPPSTGPTERMPALTPDATAISTPSRPGTPKPPPRPAPGGERAAEPTRMVALDEAKAQAPAPTEAVMWYGMLRCTSGPLEGQTFIIEEDGLYIGRDSTLSKVVIDDSRVSKRHLRVVPRNGKVWAIDQGSTNGTFLVTSAGRERIKEHQLKRSESIALADAATFIYQI